MAVESANIWCLGTGETRNGAVSFKEVLEEPARLFLEV